MLEQICDSPIWTQSQSWDTQSPTLSSCMIETAFVWLPAIFLFLCIPYMIWDCLKSNKKSIHWNYYNISRLLITIVCTGIALSKLILCFCRKYQWDDNPTTGHLISTVVQTTTRLILCIVFYCHRKYGIHYSGCIWTYLVLDTILGSLSVATFATQVMRLKYEFILYCIQFSLTVIILLFCSFADQLPPNSDNTETNDDNICPEDKASFPSKLTFHWMNNLLIKFLKQKSLKITDIWPVRHKNSTIYNFNCFDKHWKNSKKSNTLCPTDLSSSEKVLIPSFLSKLINKQTVNITKTKLSTNLYMVLFKTYGFSYLSISLLFIIASCIRVAQPIVIRLMIRFTEDPAEPQWHGYVYTILLIAINMIYSFTFSFYMQKTQTIGQRITSCLTSAVYRKSLVLNYNNSKSQITNGEIISLMSIDCTRFADELNFMIFILVSPVQIVVIFALLYNELGVSAFAGLGIILLLYIICTVVSKYVKQFIIKQMKIKDQRIQLTNDILNGIKVAKLYAWEEAFYKILTKLRSKEIGQLRWATMLDITYIILGSCAPYWIMFVSLVTYIYVDSGHQLNAENLFVSLSLCQFIKYSLNYLPFGVKSLISNTVAIKRLNNFLNLDIKSDFVNHNEDQYRVRVENGSFSWTTINNHLNNNTFTLNDINLKIADKAFVAVVGNVGSGKSSLLAALFGEMERLSGNVNIKIGTKIAYVPQQAWIQNASLKNNILFDKTLDNELYQKVIQCCALSQDLRQLSAGDETEIGEKGINLSGGQKQRVSLARAVYSDADLYLLDDPLSAVDSHVGKHIMNEVLDSRTGLLKNKTRILVTNQLFVLPNVDLIVVLKDGKISSIGSYDYLIKEDHEFSDLVKLYSVEENNNEDKTDKNDNKNDNNNNILKQNIVETNNENKQLIDEEYIEDGEIKFKVYLNYAKEMTIILSTLMLILFMASNVFIIGINLWLNRWSKHTGVHQQYSYQLIILAVLTICQMLTLFIGRYSLIIGSLVASKRMHNKMLWSVMRSPMKFFDTTPLGRIVNRFSKDVDTIDTFSHFILGFVLDFVLQCIASIIIISIKTPLFIAPLVVMCFVFCIFQHYYTKLSCQLKRFESINRSPIYAYFSETINGLSSIRAYGCSDRFIKQLEKKVDTYLSCLYPYVSANNWLQIRIDLISSILVFFVGLFVILKRETFQGGDTGMSLANVVCLSVSFSFIGRLITQFEDSMVSFERLDEYCKLKPEAEWKSNNQLPENWPNMGCIDFQKYSTKYREGLDLVLNKIDIIIKAGEKIGIVGRTGAGKSSLTLALFRLIESVSGKIVIDGIDISQLSLQELRSRLTIIPQDPVLFSGTIRSNLDPFEKSSDNDLWKALENSHLKSFIKSQDKGLDYHVSEGGDNLSVGQRQLICLARALLRHTAVLILDEATAAVDVETDALIQQTIRQEFKLCTVITIAHRLNTIMDSDRVLVLNEGRVAEFDSPNNLLIDNQTIFYSLAKDAGLV